jgi:hypothetical protein
MVRKMTMAVKKFYMVGHWSPSGLGAGAAEVLYGF